MHNLARHHGEGGFSLVEMIVVLAIIGILIGIASFDFRQIENEAFNGASEVMGFIKRTRAKALTSTMSYTLRPGSATSVVTTHSDSCTGTQVNDPTLTMDLPDGAFFTDITWSLCFNSRGLSDNSADIVIGDSYRQATVQVVLGGGIRLL